MQGAILWMYFLPNFIWYTGDEVTETYGDFLRPEKYPLFERFSKFICLLVILTIGKQGEKKVWSNANQMDQPITANGAWFSRRLNKCDDIWKQMWSADGHQLILIFICSWILIWNNSLKKKFFTLWKWQGKKPFVQLFSLWQGQREENVFKKSLLVKVTRKINFSPGHLSFTKEKKSFEGKKRFFSLQVTINRLA